MNIIRIRKSEKSSMEVLKKNSTTLGLPESELVPNADADYVWINDALFQREIEQCFFYFHFSKGQYSGPAVMCQCGGTHFEIRFGFYKCLARCIQCGAEEVIYDG